MGYFFNRILGRMAPQGKSSAPLSPHSTVAHRSLDGATGGRRGAPLGHFHNVNAEVGAGAHLVSRRAAYLAANNPWIANGTGNLTSYLTGTGARPARAMQNYGVI